MRAIFPLLLSTLLLVSCGDDDAPSGGGGPSTLVPATGTAEVDRGEVEAEVGGSGLVTSLAAVETLEVTAPQAMTWGSLTAEMQDFSDDHNKATPGQVFMVETMEKGPWKRDDNTTIASCTVRTVKKSKVLESEGMQAKIQETIVRQSDSAECAATLGATTTQERIVNIIDQQDLFQDFQGHREVKYSKGALGDKTLYVLNIDLQQDDLKGRATRMYDPRESGLYNMVFEHFSGSKDGQPYERTIRTTLE